MPDSPIENAHRTIRRALEAYGDGLAAKAEFVILNKCDALNDALLGKQRQSLDKIHRPVQRIHAPDTAMSRLTVAFAAFFGQDSVIRKRRADSIQDDCFSRSIA